MKQTSVLAAAALNGSASLMAAPAQHPAKPNAPPGYTLKVDCSNRDLTITGELHKFLTVLSNAYASRQYRTNC